MPTPATRIDVTSDKARAKEVWSVSLDFLNKAGEAAKAAAKAAAAVPEAHEGASQASAAGAILDFIDKKQDQIIAAGIDPASFFADLLTEAHTLIQSAQDHNINAGNAA